MKTFAICRTDSFVQSVLVALGWEVGLIENHTVTLVRESSDEPVYSTACLVDLEGQ